MYRLQSKSAYNEKSWSQLKTARFALLKVAYLKDLLYSNYAVLISGVFTLPKTPQINQKIKECLYEELESENIVLSN